MATASSGAARAISKGLRTSSIRKISTTNIIRLPRQGLPRPPSLSSASTSASRLEDLPQASFTDNHLVQKASNSTTPELPWFLQDEENIEITPSPKRTTKQTSSTAAVNLHLPEPLSSLHLFLTEGSPSALIARPEDFDELENDLHRKPPIVYINAKSHSEDAWADWIVVVQVKSNAGGSVSRVAKDIGGFLKYQSPPMFDTYDAVHEVEEPSIAPLERQIESIEDFLSNPDSELSSRSRAREIKPAEKMSIATETQTNGNEGAGSIGPWRPYKIISREAQDGLRLLHSSDSEKWTRKELAGTFKISVESVRRILKSDWKPTAQTVARQNRRALEREQEKRAGRSVALIEDEEIESIRTAMQKGNENVDEDVQEYQLQGEESNREVDRHVQPVSYEGLVQSADDRRKGRGRSSVTRGDGEWCLVDAGWCVVHVMTARARSTYNVEAVASNARSPHLSSMS